MKDVCVPPSAGDPQAYGTVIRYENGWAIITPHDRQRYLDALTVGALDYLDWSNG